MREIGIPENLRNRPHNVLLCTTLVTHKINQ